MELLAQRRSRWPLFGVIYHTMAVIALVLCVSAPMVGAQPTTTAVQDSPLPDEAAIAARLEAVRADASLSEEVRQAIVTTLTQAQQELKALAGHRESANGFQNLLDGLEDETARVNRALEAPPSQKNPLIATMSRVELERLRNELETQLTAKKQESVVLDSEPSRRQQRVTEIPNLMATLRDEVTRSRASLGTLAAEVENAAVTEARKAWSSLRLASLEAQISAVELENAAYAATAQLLPRQQELVAKELAALEANRKAVDERLRVLIAEESAAQVETAEAAAAASVEELKGLAAEIVSLARENQASLGSIEKLTRDLEEATSERQKVEEDFSNLQRRVDTVGLTAALGAALRSKRIELGRIRNAFSPEAFEDDELRTVQLRMIELQEERRQTLNELESRDALIESILKAHPEKDPDSVGAEIDRLSRAKLDQLASLLANSQVRFERWVAGDTARRELCKRVDEYLHYVEERVLWVRSSEPLHRIGFATIVQDYSRLLDKEAWQTSWLAIISDVSANLIFFPTLLVLVLLTWGYRGTLRETLVAQGRLAGRKSCQEFLPTLWATLATLVLASLWPLVLMLLGWRLSNPPDPAALTASIGEALVHTGLFLWPIEVVRQITRPDGLAERHFGWEAKSRISIRQRVRRYGWIAPVLFFVAESFHLLEENTISERGGMSEGGRILYVALLMLTLWEVGLLVHPSRGVWADWAETRPESLLYRLRKPLTAMAILSIVSLLVMEFLGYHYTSQQLARRGFQSVIVLISVAVVSAMLRRWLFIRRRRLALRQYRDRLDQQRSRAESTQRLAEVLGLELPTDSEVNLAALNQQTRQLIHFAVVLSASIGLFLCWYDVLPALGMFGEIALWNGVQGNEVVPVTVSHLTLAFLVSLITMVSVRNVPALLEMVLLQHLPFDSGARFAVTTITRYVILIVGVVVGLSFLHVPWSQYSWLVAAASVGLGFGLQEIFANFVSGLIVLLERPCRVGDVVTVDGVTGVVTRIQMRATTVMNWDQQELVVPNKEFVTGKLLNWTLSSSVNRLQIAVGVAYDSDPEQVSRLLMEIVSSQPNVMKEPAPTVTFERLGSEAFEFQIRCFLPSLDLRLSTLHAIHSQIAIRFREAGISLPYPARDLYLRSLPDPLLTRFGLMPTQGRGGQDGDRSDIPPGP